MSTCSVPNARTKPKLVVDEPPCCPRHHFFGNVHTGIPIIPLVVINAQTGCCSPVENVFQPLGSIGMPRKNFRSMKKYFRFDGKFQVYVGVAEPQQVKNTDLIASVDSLYAAAPSCTPPFFEYRTKLRAKFPHFFVLFINRENFTHRPPVTYRNAYFARWSKARI